MTKRTFGSLQCLVIVAGLVVFADVFAGKPPIDQGDDRSHGRGSGLAQAAICGGKPDVPKPPSCNSKFDGIFHAGTPFSIQNELAKFAVKTLAGFVFNEVGLNDLLFPDPTQAKLDALRAQLDLISLKIDTLQISVNQISQELQRLNLDIVIANPEGWISEIQSLYIDFFEPALIGLENYAEADLAATAAGSTCNASQSCTTLRQFFEDRREEFLQQMASKATLNVNLHNSLMPGPANSSVMSAYGNYLMRGPGSTGILKSSDSDLLYAFYEYFAEWEALATWMKAEWNGVRFEASPSQFKAFIDLQITGFQNAEFANLPPPIPENTIIMLPVNPGDRQSTLNQPMWIWDGTEGRTSIGFDLSWEFFSPAGTAPLESYCRRDQQPRCRADGAINTFNQTQLGLGFTDWQAPSLAHYDQLYALGAYSPNSKDFGSFIDEQFRHADDDGSLNLEDAFQWNPHVWISEQSTISCNSAGFISRFEGQVAWAYKAVRVDVSLRETLSTVTIPSELDMSAQGGSVFTGILLGLSTNSPYFDPEQTLEWCRSELVEWWAPLVTAGFNNEWQTRYGPLAAHLLATRNTTVHYMP
ncbi:hypothetical protein ACFL1V_00005 [Pseudomonadota bacterium]